MWHVFVPTPYFGQNGSSRYANNPFSGVVAPTSRELYRRRKLANLH